MKSLRRYLSLHAIIQWFKGLSLVIIYLLMGGVTGWYGARLTIGDQWVLVRLGSYFAPWLFMSLIPALPVALMTRQRRLAGSLGILIVFFGLPYGALFRLPGLPPAKAEGTVNTLRVMTFNVHYTNRNAPEIADMILAQQPDVIALQEVTGDLARLLLPRLAAAYPYHLIDAGNALVSRYPLTQRSKPPDLGRAQHAAVETPDGLVTIWNIHPPTAVSHRGWQAQRRTLETIAGALEQTHGPLIVLGDFNTTPDSENYELIAHQLTDVHRVAGRNFGFTFPDIDSRNNRSWYTRPIRLIKPVVRIDYIFVSRHFTPSNTEAASDNPGSDHRPVTATLHFTD